MNDDKMRFATEKGFVVYALFYSDGKFTHLVKKETKK